MSKGSNSSGWLSDLFGGQDKTYTDKGGNDVRMSQSESDRATNVENRIKTLIVISDFLSPFFYLLLLSNGGTNLRYASKSLFRCLIISW